MSSFTASINLTLTLAGLPPAWQFQPQHPSASGPAIPPQSPPKEKHFHLSNLQLCFLSAAACDRLSRTPLTPDYAVYISERGD